MSVIKKIFTSIALVVTVIIMACIILLGIYEGGFFFLAPSYNKMDKYLKENNDKLSYVADALSELDYDSIVIRKTPLREEEKYSMTVKNESGYETIPIPSELVEGIEVLYESGVKVISCGHNSVGFTIWSILDESRGIEYSLTGEKPDGEQLIEVKQLSKENWYYYVHNFEKAKTRNPQLFQ